MSGIKSCLYCENIRFEESKQWSEVTYESESYECIKKHFYCASTDMADLQGWTLRAITCCDYALSGKVIIELNKRADDYCSKQAKHIQ